MVKPVHAFTVEKSASFASWLQALNVTTRAIVLARIDRLERGLLGDAKSVGDGVFELRIDYGPGYRVYFTIRDGKVVLLLAGGDKATQKKDIKAAKKML